MRAVTLPVILVIILSASALAGYYYYNPARVSSSHSTSGLSSNNVCSNGTTNYPSCNTCPAGQNLTNNHCTTISNANPNCANGATDRGSCISCPSGQSLANGICTNNCSNAAPNPPACDYRTSNCHDPDNISSHVVSPERLTIIIPCVTVSGSVVENGGINDRQPDGDTHVSINVDPQYQWLVNQGDIQGQSGHLLMEVVCAHPVLNPPRECNGYTSNVTIPSERQHIIATGPYVNDKGNNNWGEIHPVYNITIEYSHNTTITENLTVSYPNEESNGWLGARSQSHMKTVVVKDGLQLVDVLTLNNTSASTQQITGIYVTTKNLNQVSLSPNVPITFAPRAIVKVTMTIDIPYWYYTRPVDLYIVAS